MILLLAAMVICGIGTAAALALGRWPMASKGAALGAMGLAGLLALAGGAAHFISPGWGGSAANLGRLPLGAMALAMTDLGAWFCLPAGLLSLATAIHAWGYYRDAGGARMAWHGAMLNVMVGAILMVLCADDVAAFLLGWEAMSLASFFLIQFDDADAAARRGAWMYLVCTHLGTALCVLPMFGILIGLAGGTSFGALAASAGGVSGGMAVALFLLAAAGFGTKAGLAPMHVWLPAAHPVAPGPVSALMSGIVIKTGIFGLLRVIFWLPGLPAWCGAALLAVGAITGLWGILQALGQGNLKRLLAYSSVENIGIIALAIGVAMIGRANGNDLLWTLGMAGALAHVLNHGLFKGLLFLSGGAVVHATGTGDLDRLGGLAKVMPHNAAMFLAATVAICALPPMNGLVGEWMIYQALFGAAMMKNGLSAAAAMAGLAALALIGGLALATFTKAFGIPFLGEKRDATIHAHPIDKSMIGGMAILAVACLGIGLAPAVLIPPLMRTVGSAAFGQSAPGAMGSLVWVGIVGAAVIAATTGLWIWRRRVAANRPPATTGPTWGCGFVAPTPRMQYTGTGLADSLVETFAAALRPRRRGGVPAELFPRSGALAVDITDGMLDRVHAPAFFAVRRAARRLRPMARGKVQVYLLCLAGTLLAVFVVEAGMEWGEAPLIEKTIPTIEEGTGARRPRDVGREMGAASEGALEADAGAGRPRDVGREAGAVGEETLARDAEARRPRDVEREAGAAGEGTLTRDGGAGGSRHGGEMREEGMQP